MTRRRAFRDERYWGRPVPGWGSERPRLLIVGLAPAAHGGNRTGRIFTGDRSGDFLFASLYRTGFAVQPASVSAGDGQRLVDARMAAAVRCAPPANKPEPAERDACAPWLVAELRLVAADLRVVVCLGGFAWQAIWPALGRCGFARPRPRPAFGHGAEVRLAGPHAPDGVLVIGCYHPSQQNTFTGRVTPAMLDAVFTRARAAAGLDAPRPLSRRTASATASASAEPSAGAFPDQASEQSPCRPKQARPGPAGVHAAPSWYRPKPAKDKDQDAR